MHLKIALNRFPFSSLVCAIVCKDCYEPRERIFQHEKYLMIPLITQTQMSGMKSANSLFVIR